MDSKSVIRVAQQAEVITVDDGDVLQKMEKVPEPKDVGDFNPSQS
jgi:hypothetical protein